MKGLKKVQFCCLLRRYVSEVQPEPRGLPDVRIRGWETGRK